MVQVTFSCRTKLIPSTQMGKEVGEDGGYANSVLLLCRPQPGIVVDVTLSARFWCSVRLQLLQPIQEGAQTRTGEPKTALEAAVKSLRVVGSSWPYVIIIDVLRPQTRGKFASYPGTAEVRR